jgi:hypothetical protein
VPATQEPRISRLSGKVIEPVKRKPEIRVELLIDDDRGPAARRAEPRPAPVASTAQKQTDNDPNLVVLERAVKRDDQTERDAVAATKAKLRATCLKNAQAAADVVAAWAGEHREYFQRLERVLSSGELLRQAGNGSRDRLNKLDGVVKSVLRSLNLLSGFPAQVEKAIADVTAASLVPAMTSRGEGYEVDTMRSPGITRVERLAATSSAEGVLRSLNESLETARVIVGEIAERIGQQKLTSTLEQPVTYAISPETQSMREALRPSPVLSRADNGGPPGNESEWNPLDYTPGGRN